MNLQALDVQNLCPYLAWDLTVTSVVFSSCKRQVGRGFPCGLPVMGNNVSHCRCLWGLLRGCGGLPLQFFLVTMIEFLVILEVIITLTLGSCSSCGSLGRN